MTNLQGTSFSDQPLVQKPRVLWDICGYGKSGKTDFAVKTTPGLIGYMAFDMGDEGVVDKYQYAEDGSLRIRRATYQHATMIEVKPELNTGADAGGFNDRALKVAPAPDLKAFYRAIMHKFKNDYYTAIDRGVRTLVVDTADDVDENLRLAEHGKTIQIKQQHYFPINQFERDLWLKAKGGTTNVITLSRGRPEVESTGEDKWRRTGRMARNRWHDNADFAVHAFFEARYVEPVKQLIAGTMQITQEGRFELELIRSRQAPKLVGTVWVNDDIDFPLVASMVYPDIDPEVWVDTMPRRK